MRISVCIPTYSQQGKSKEYLTHSFNILALQSFKDFEVCVSDDSDNDDVKNVCDSFKDKLNITYSKNEYALGISGNTNKAMSLAKGELIKVLFMDDYLFHSDALKDISEAFVGNWLVTASEHSRDGITHFRALYPRYNHMIHTGLNTISSPSVLTVRNDGHLDFDGTLIWLMDCEYYKRCYLKFGEPTVLNKVNVVNRISEYQTTSTLMDEVKRVEVNLMKQKYV